MLPAFEMEQVCLEADGTHILTDITVCVPGQGITVVLGPSGAGKSTLLRLCNRLEVPTSGTVRYRGDDVAHLDPLTLRRRVGMVFQRPTLFPGTVRDNLLIACSDAGESALVEVLERVTLSRPFLDRNGDSLSGGEAQRACLARTLLCKPESLLMDEPTSSLDTDNVRLLEQTARDLAADSTTIIWVTHDLNQADRIADHTIKLEVGRVVG